MKSFITLGLVLGMWQAVNAQYSTSPGSTLPGSTTVTLEQCIAMALENQPSLRQSALQQKIAENTVEQTRKSQLPTVSGYSNQGLNFGRNVDPYTNGITNSQITTNTLGLGVNWIVFNGFQLKNTLSQQGLNAQASQYDVAAAKNTTTLNTLLAYLQVLSAQDMLMASELQVRVAQEQVDRTARLVKAGTTAPFNLYDAQSQLANDRMQYVQNQTTLKAAMLTLLQVLNLPSGTQLDVVRLTETFLVKTAGTDAYQVYNQARTVMPEVLAADLRTKAAQKSLELAKGLAYPSITLSANWGTSYSSAARQSVYGNELVEQSTTGFVDVAGQPYPVKILSPIVNSERIGYFHQVDNNQYKSVGLSIRMPILNGFQVRYRTTNARLQQQLAESQAEGVRRTLRQAIDQAVNQQQNAYERYTALNQQVEALTQSYKAAEARYDKGLLNAVDYNLAKSNMDRATVSLIQTKYEILLREKVVEFYRNGTL